MRVAVLGSGGREHALVKAIGLSPKVTNVFCIPGSDGIAKDGTCLNVPLNETQKLCETLTSNQIDFIVVGPEDPLVNGIADVLRSKGFKVFGPNQKGAQLEGSKIYSKEFMKAADIPTAHFAVAKNKEEAFGLIEEFNFPTVVKADVLAAGKGVFICKNKDDFSVAMKNIFDDQVFGKSNVLIEEFISGWELSYIVVTDGKDYQVCPLVQDHKALKDGGEGPNTGGMGVFGPIKIKASLQEEINKTIVEPTLRQLEKLDIPYKGVIFIGLMIREDKPYVLEYNVRFGDPETQIILPLIDGDIFDILYSVETNRLKEIKVKNNFAACVVMAAEGYPEKPVKGSIIEMTSDKSSSDSYFIYAGVTKKDNDFVVSGGRVLGAVGIAKTKDEALQKAYSQSKKAKWKGMQMRNDIGRFFN